MIFNNEKTRLREGDVVAYSEKTGIIMFLRKNQPLLFSDGSAHAFVYLQDLKFLFLIKILAETNELECPSSIQEIQPFSIIIEGREYLHYIF